MAPQLGGGTGWVAYSFLLRWLVISKIGWLWPVEERASIASVPVYCHMAKAVRDEARAESRAPFPLPMLNAVWSLRGPARTEVRRLRVAARGGGYPCAIQARIAQTPWVGGTFDEGYEQGFGIRPDESEGNDSQGGKPPDTRYT